MQAMTDPKELDALCPGESKRQREALRRKLDRGGHTCGIGLSTIGGQNVELSHNEHRSKHDPLQASSQEPGLLEKFTSAKTNAEKLIPQIMTSVFIEGQYIVVAQCFEVRSAQNVHHGPISGVHHGRDALCGATISAGICFCDF
jgi:hypothetical protein